MIQAANTLKGVIPSNAVTNWDIASRRSETRKFFTRSRKSRDFAEAYNAYVAQGIPKIDVEIVKKGRF